MLSVTPFPLHFWYLPLYWFFPLTWNWIPAQVFLDSRQQTETIFPHSHYLLSEGGEELAFTEGLLGIGTMLGDILA